MGRLKRIVQRIKNSFLRVRQIIQHYPLRSFFGLLALFLVLVVMTNWLGQPTPPPETTSPEPKKVETYRIGDIPTMRFVGKIDKSGVITVTSQGAGIVSGIHVTEGQEVSKGTWLITLSSNYQGGNAASLQRKIAEASYTHAKDNLPVQIELVGKRREIAEKTDTNADDLRTITKDSIQNTKDTLTISKQTLALIDQQLVTTPDNTTLLQQKIGLLNGISASEQAIKNAELASSDDRAPAQLSNLGKDMTIKQLDLEEKSLSLNLEIAELNFRLAQVAESTMFPSAPFAGTVERVHVKVGQAISPATPLITFAGNEQTANVELFIPEDIAKNINRVEPSILSWGTQRIEVTPYYISAEPTQGSLFSVLYTLPPEFVKTSQRPTPVSQKGASALVSRSLVTQGRYISIDVPIGTTQSSTSIPFVPLDALYQTESEAYINTIVDGKVSSQEVTLGPVLGKYVQVLSGVSGDTDVILDRIVVAGEEVTPHF